MGLGISADHEPLKSARQSLESFIARRFPGATVLRTMRGGVPCSPTLERIVADGLMLVGDAARQANPVSGGGVTTAMLAGGIAGRVAGAAVREGDVSEARLREYPREWHRLQGKSHEKFYQARRLLHKMTDEELDRTADAVLRLPPESRTLKSLFRAALVNDPRLLFDLFRLWFSK